MEPEAEWMRQCLEWARRAAAEGEVPVGAMVVREAVVLGVGWNRTEQLADPSAHAEVIALRRASARVGNHRLGGATLVVTLEPCTMCVGALLEARVDRVVWGIDDAARGAISLGVVERLARWPGKLPHWRGGVESEACLGVLQQYFEERRS